MPSCGADADEAAPEELLPCLETDRHFKLTYTGPHPPSTSKYDCHALAVELSQLGRSFSRGAHLSAC